MLASRTDRGYNNRDALPEDLNNSLFRLPKEPSVVAIVFPEKTAPVLGCVFPGPSAEHTNKGTQLDRTKAQQRSGIPTDPLAFRA